MATDTATTFEEAQAKGFFGTVNKTVPSGATLAGAVVNSDDAPTPAKVDGPGAKQASTADDKEKDK